MKKTLKRELKALRDWHIDKARQHRQLTAILIFPAYHEREAAFHEAAAKAIDKGIDGKS